MTQGSPPRRRAAQRLPLVLASRSPQRRAILECLGVSFTVRPSDAPELERGEPEAIARENALRKARAASIHGRREAVLGCDTVVALGGVVYGKPVSEREARETLSALSGVTHEVLSGVALLLPGEQRLALERTAVSFRSLAPSQIDSYVATGEWRGRAGGYAIQGAGAALVRELRGDYENVVGLPLAALLELYPELLGG